MTSKAITKAPDGRNATLAEHVAAIRALGKQTITSIIAIGGHLVACKDLVGHRNFGCWLDKEFGWSERTAQRFMSVHELVGKSDKLSDLDLPVSAFYLLAAPSTPEPVRNEILGRAKAGEKIELEEVKEIIAEAKPARRVRNTKSSSKASDTPPVLEDAVAFADAVGSSGTPTTAAVFAPDVAGGGKSVRLQKRLAELEDINRRLEIRSKGLESEIDELKTARKPKVADTKDTVYCSFCNKSQHKVRTVVSSPISKKVFICNECVAVCNEVIAKQVAAAPAVDDELDIPADLRRAAPEPDPEPNTNITDLQKTTTVH